MEKYTVSKTIGLVAGIIIILSALGFGGLYMLGTSLGKALGSQTGPSVDVPFMFVVLMCILLIGFITGLGSLGLKRKGWRNGICFILLEHGTLSPDCLF
ncbi:hypothetical protein [Fictibacillus enclensis]|uniref:hypothetical protein n=1 Tax=Fictibacillus enclensis TaxID=1017270 RepID=UPI0024BFBAAC|nr:hypothetical protein [Fictibacillus enclensis]WHY74789.1 hypothetical protein QNH15_13160 [Fictibacillus enclensis]